MKGAQITPKESCCYHIWPPVKLHGYCNLSLFCLVLCLPSHQHVPSQSVCLRVCVCVSE